MAMHAVRKSLFLALIWVYSIPANAQSHQLDMFWDPNIDQPIQQLEEILSQAKQQQPMNYTIANISFLYDAKLLILFQKYLERIPASKRQEEIKKQNIWVEDRWKSIKKESDEYDGGTMGPFATGRLKIDLTKKRIKAIEDLLKASQP